MHDKVEIPVGDVAIGSEVALLVLRAGGKGETELRGRAAGGRRRARAADRAQRIAGTEAIPVMPAGPQALGLGVHGVGLGRHSLHGGLRDHARELLVLGNLPIDRDRAVGHAAAFQRPRCEPGPQHDAFLARAARSDAEREGIGGEGERLSADDSDRTGDRTGGQRTGEEAATRKLHGRCLWNKALFRLSCSLSR